ncbi:MAG TPA: NAD(P)/FAD-dependent oxidoreductase [Chloroflexota bacterium]|nr:NAD(P)/FAD-dependent oxidoreductase [Chloroflexota bacterium]
MAGNQAPSRASRYDAIVVGARCAGSPTAMLLSRKGHRVLLVDRDAFPSDIFRAHVIRMPGVQALARWGLYEAVLATGCAPFSTYTFDFDDFPLTGCPPFPDGSPREVAPRRKILDAILVNAAVEAGAELREQVAIDDLLWEDGRVVGVRGRSGGQAFEARASLVVGADGQHSLVARKTGAAIRHSTLPLTFGYYTYWADVPATGLEVIQRMDAGRVIIVFPTNDNLTCVAVQGRSDDFPAFRADLEGEYLRAVNLADDVAARVRAGRRAERFQGTADLPNFIRAAAGPGWALVGDAGYHRDPLLAHGISDAFHSAELLSEVIGDALAGEASLDEALAAYDRLHAEAALAGFEETVQACAFRPFPPELLQQRAAVRGDQAATDRFYGELFGLTPPE